MNDRFGQIMFDNLKQRSCYLIGIDSCETIDKQIERYINGNFLSTGKKILYVRHNFLSHLKIFPLTFQKWKNFYQLEKLNSLHKNS